MPVVPLALVFGCLTGCTPDELEVVDLGGVVAPISETRVAVDFAGAVAAADGEPIAGARVRIGAAELRTDALGRWTLMGASVPADEAVVEVVADGYLPTAHTLLVDEDAAYELSTALLPAAGGPAIDVAEVPGLGSALTDGLFEPASARPPIGYTLDLTSEAAHRFLPGDLRVVDATDVAGVIEPYAAVLLDAASAGEPAGPTVRITVPATSGIAPPTEDLPELTLYAFDAAVGGWRALAAATPTADGYSASVSQLAEALLVGVTRPRIRVAGTLVFGDDGALPDHRTAVRLADASGRTRGGATPDAQGRFALLAPAASPLALDLVDAAGATVQTFDFTAADADLAVGDLAVPADRLVAGVLTGRVVCGGTPLALVPVDLEIAGRPVAAVLTDSAGAYRLSASAAPGTQVRVSAYGSDLAGFSGQGVSRPLDGDAALGDLSACGLSTERARLLVDDQVVHDVGQTVATLAGGDLRITSTPPGAASPGLVAVLTGIDAVPVGDTEATAGAGSTVELLGPDGTPTDRFSLADAPLEIQRVEAGAGAQVVIGFGPVTVTNDIRQGGLYVVRGEVKIRAPK